MCNRCIHIFSGIWHEHLVYRFLGVIHIERNLCLYDCVMTITYKISLDIISKHMFLTNTMIYLPWYFRSDNYIARLLSLQLTNLCWDRSIVQCMSDSTLFDNNNFGTYITIYWKDDNADWINHVGRIYIMISFDYWLMRYPLCVSTIFV